MTRTPGFGTRRMNQIFSNPASAGMSVTTQEQVRREAQTIDAAEEARALRAAQNHEAQNSAFAEAAVDLGDQTISEMQDLGTALELDTVTSQEAMRRLEKAERALDSLRHRREQVTGTEALVQTIRDDPHQHQERLAAKYPHLQHSRVQRGLSGD